jgi:hypothetical protein
VKPRESVDLNVVVCEGFLVVSSASGDVDREINRYLIF